MTIDDIKSKEDYKKVRASAFEMLKNRMLERSDIIHKRLEAESKLLESKFNELQNKGTNATKGEEDECQKRFEEISFKIEILTERASQHYKKALTKFTELDEKLKKDPRFAKFQD